MGHLFDAGEQQCSTQRGRPFAWAALAPKKRGVLAPPVASVTPVSSALAGRRLRGTPAPYRIAAPMLDRRRFLKLAGLTALAAAAPRIGEPTEHAGLLHLTATEAVRHISEGSLSAETYARALLFARANRQEGALGITSHNYHFGAVRNPYDSTLIPGGSSGGTGAGIAARVCPAGLGTDTGGSVRIPAALCGVVGLRPTKGRYSIAGIVPISHTRDTPGPMGRTVADVALLDAVETLTTPARPARLRGLRLGVPRNPFWQDLDPEVAAVMEDALHRLRALGVVLVEVDVPGVVTLDQQAGFPIALFEANLDIPAYLAAEGNGITFDDIQRQIASPDVAGAIAAARGGAIPQAVYEHALNVVRPELQALYASYFADNGVAAMVFPTTVLPARPIGQDQTVELNGRQVDTFTTYIRNTDADAVAGIPGLALPAGRTRSGLPVGMELDGPMGSDRLLLSVGLALEASAFRPLRAPKLAIAEDG